MLIRIVKMSFKQKHIDEFLSNFNSNKDAIRNFEGCQFLELYRDQYNTTVFFTYSFWNTKANLESYRHSKLFKHVWSKTKPLFNAKPEAWSVDKIVSLK